MKIRRPRATKLSQLTIDTNLAMGAFNITLGAGQTVDGKDISAIPDADMLKSVYDPNADDVIEGEEISLEKNIDTFKPENTPKVVSDVLRNSHDAESANVTSTSYVKMKTITITRGIKGTLRFKVGLWISSSSYTVYGKVYKNGVAVGVEKSWGTIGWSSTLVDDVNVGEVKAGETLEMWIKVSAGIGKVRNFRINYDDAAAVVACPSTNS